jgi:tRNA modification GTPase
VKDNPYDTEDLIAALATPWAAGALAIIRTSGEGCIRAFTPVFSNSGQLVEAPSGTMVFGYLHDREGIEVDQVMLGIFRAGHGYTGQESVEIYCHGSLPGIQRILDLLRSEGFRDAAPGEFSMRAFLNGKMDLTRAEAVHEIIAAKTRRAHSLALNRLSGAVWQRIDALKTQLKQILALVELQLDYPEDELEELPSLPLDEMEKIGGGIEELLATYRAGRLYQEGVTVALAGPTNAGKSALFNLFLKEDRSIVSGVHGTTRDYIESWITISGIPVRLFDTAGLRDAEHPVEAEGIRRSARIIENAGLVLYIVDGTAGLSEWDRQVLQEREIIPGGGDRNYLFVWNKIDLAAQPAPEGWLPLSAETGEGFSRLEKELSSRILGAASAEGEVMIDSRRQRELLVRAGGALRQAVQAAGDGMAMDFIAADLREALDALGEITGEVTSADILNQIFGDFCVGK